MTERPTWPSSRNWRTQVRTQSRSSRQQTWPTLLATWLRRLANCRNKRHRWRRSPTSAIKSDILGRKGVLSNSDNSTADFFPVFWFCDNRYSCFRVQIRASLPTPQLPKNQPRGSEACVWTIWKDVKLLSVDFVALLIWFIGSSWLFLAFSLLSSRGAQKAHRAVPNEALYGVLRISRLITWTYLHLFWNNFTVMGRG